MFIDVAGGCGAGAGVAEAGADEAVGEVVDPHEPATMAAAITPMKRG
jgi:hypothetical protein